MELLGNMVERACPMCDSTDHSHVLVESTLDPAKLGEFAFASRKAPEYLHPRLVKCPSCRLVYASPTPQVSSLESAYEKADYDSRQESRLAAETYGRSVRGFLGKLPDRVGALDIGAGDGAFLEELIRLGFTGVVGVEPSAAPIQAASPSVRGLIRPGFFRGEDFSPQAFSLITCFQTIEHVPDPAALAGDAYALLKPGGALLIICHNINALSAKVLGFKSPIFDVEHLQLFSLSTATNLLARAGFGEIRGHGILNRYPLDYYLKLLPIGNRIKALLRATGQRLGYGRLLLPAALGNIVVVGFRPGEQS